MSMSFAHLESEALKLPREDRARLANHLLASVHADREVDEAWAAEIDRRVHAIEEGRAVLVPADDAIAKARRMLA
jgi:putative addiction module component (TIGR02574 family)